jgi:hypothetical protein
MTGSPPELRSFLEAEMFYGVKKRERIAYLVAGGGLAIGLMGMIAVVTMLPLKQTEAFLAIVDKDTGVAERVVAVEKAGIEQAEAIRQSLLFAYVTDRETYDQHDNESRILRAYTWSGSSSICVSRSDRASQIEGIRPWYRRSIGLQPPAWRLVRSASLRRVHGSYLADWLRMAPALSAGRPQDNDMVGGAGGSRIFLLRAKRFGSSSGFVDGDV